MAETISRLLAQARTRWMLDVDGLPVRKMCCETCNYGIKPNPIQELVSFSAAVSETHVTDVGKLLGKHRCHSATGSICFGSHVSYLPTQDARIKAIEDSFSLQGER